MKTIRVLQPRVNDLETRGISGDVTFNVSAGTYNESVSIPEIQGVSVANTIHFQGIGSPVISTTIPPALLLDGADYITFNAIDFSIGIAGTIIEITNDADTNAVQSCTVTGYDKSEDVSVGVEIWRRKGMTLIFFMTSISMRTGLRLFSMEQVLPRIEESGYRIASFMNAWRGSQYNEQDGAHIWGNFINPGWDGSNNDVTGIYVDAISVDDTCYIYDNSISNFRTTNEATGITIWGIDGTARIYNNMFGLWDTRSFRMLRDLLLRFWRCGCLFQQHPHQRD